VAASPSSSESVIGMEARIQKLPSSRCGRNSLPSRGAIRKKVPEKDKFHSDHQSAVVQRKTQGGIVDAVQQADDDRLGFLHVLGKQEGARTGVTVKVAIKAPPARSRRCAPWAEDLALDSLHGEQRHETGHRDERREEDRLVHLQRADQNQPQAVGPSVAGQRACFRDLRRVRPPKALRQTLEQALPFFGLALEIPEDILHQDHRRIHDDAEIHRAHGKQVGAFALHHQQDDGEEKRERDVHPHDDGAAEVPQENPLDQEDQQASENEVVQNGVGGERSGGAVVKGNHLDSRRQAPVAIHFVDHRP
jgi:hypothetical protein